MNWFTRLRKKYILPLKWNVKRRKYIHGLELRDKKDIVDVKGIMEKEFTRQERLERKEEMNRISEQIELLNWVLKIDDDTKN